MNPQQQQFAPNVAEPWVLYDSIVICDEDGMYGSESTTPGFFTNFATFAAQESHTFFKTRTEGMVGLEYTNMQSADSMDFAFECYSFGCAIISPGVRVSGIVSEGVISGLNTGALHWFETELPRHCSVQLKINQDILCELPAMQCSPGYGMSGGGASFAHNAYEVANNDYLPVLNFAMSQGVPTMKNRWQFTKRDEQTGEIVPNPVKIPRTASVEVILIISEYARTILKTIGGPLNYLFHNPDGTAIVTFPQRCLLQASLAGKRLVQQRAQYHR
jgi:hypothetical protein